MATSTSRIPGFHKLAVDERLARMAQLAELSPADVAVLGDHGPALLDRCDRMIENVVGVFHLPVGLAANFRIDGTDRLVPMVIEEPSVVAAASHAALLLREGEGIHTEATDPIMIGQVQLALVPDVDTAKARILAEQRSLLAAADASQPALLGRGGGARELVLRALPDTPVGPMLIVHLLVDVRDAMGANLVNGMCETLAPALEALSGGRSTLRILSNLADRRLCSARGRVPLDLLAMKRVGLSGRDVAERIVLASAFAEADPYRAATHNKGIMNGVDAFSLATGQDWRAMEAGAHAFAARSGRYTALAWWRIEDDALVGRITLPVQVGTVGGVTKVHPGVKVLLRVLGAREASDVGRVAAAVGLAQNLAAIKALATEGIQRGHMSLHARNVAASLGASGEDIDRVVAEMVRRKAYTPSLAQQILAEVRLAPTEPGPLTRDELETYRARYQQDILSAVEAVLPRGQSVLSDLAWYQLDTGGKRLRAALPLALAGALDLDPAEVVPFAAAVELLHNGTMVHDDLEARVQIRRGQPSVWARFGLSQAINCGDGMLLAAQCCLSALRADSRAQLKLARRMSRTTLALVEAQVQHRLQAGAPSLEVVRTRVGALFSLALAGAADLAGVDDEISSRLDLVGGHFGVIFQLQDELIELRGGPEIPAEFTGREGLLLGHALAADGAEARQLRRHIEEARRGLPVPPGTSLLELLRPSGTFEYAVDLLVRESDAIAEHARALPEPVGRLVVGAPIAFLAPLLETLGE